MKKLKFYLIGFSIGMIFVFFILNKKGASCTYFPNDRVIAETLTKRFEASEQFSQELKALNLDMKYVQDSIVAHGKIDFDKSNAQKEPCPQYILNYPAKNPKYQISYEKCKETANFFSIKKVN
ncbi:hypothetical protein [Elizabethkingia sp. JS20170427COW]|uniref:hypothetical protein n=1 Tax=Elizabethkingia sp. JS20170427COW TaxID=2583851 RepID=UPI001110A5EE|nr:hypothetical protein [Elizabethkingia sp. JS20170427COW]QCX53954.1 hypothetical protein FGE20_09520 [Elizabethkingia sp. JS20170427COW]